MRNAVEVAAVELAAIALLITLAEVSALILFVTMMTVWISIGCGA